MLERIDLWIGIGFVMIEPWEESARTQTIAFPPNRNAGLPLATNLVVLRPPRP